MSKLLKILKRIFCLPPLWTVVSAIFGHGFIIAVAAFDIKNNILQITSYIASAYALIITVTGLKYGKTAEEVLKGA